MWVRKRNETHSNCQSPKVVCLACAFQRRRYADCAFCRSLPVGTKRYHILIQRSSVLPPLVNLNQCLITFLALQHSSIHHKHNNGLHRLGAAVVV